MKKVISIDAETDGLWGDPFAVAAIMYDGGVEVGKILLRLPNCIVKSEWVRENVLPALQAVPVTHGWPNIAQQVASKEKLQKDAYEGMLKDFAVFYMSAKEEGFAPLWHMGHVVEAYLFRELVRLGYTGEWDAPFCPIEVATMLELSGHNPSSVDGYVSQYGLEVADYGSSHNPLYDCEVAYRVYEHLTGVANA